MRESQEREVLTTVVEEVLEQFAFLFGDPPADDLAAEGAAGDVLHAKMKFKGPCEGWVSLTAPAELCVLLAANVLGRETVGIASETAQDALKEMLNIVCGRLTHDLFGERAVFDLGVPAVHLVPHQQWQAMRRGKECLHWVVEGMPLVADIGVMR